MNGYASLNEKQFSLALQRAIPRLEYKAKSLEAENEKIRQDIFDDIWSKRNWIFGPWTRKGCSNRVSESFGMFDYTSAQIALMPIQELIKEYKNKLESITVGAAEPYLISLEDYDKLMSWGR